MSRAFRVGAFVLSALLVFSLAVFWIGSKQFLFHSTYRLNADFANVVGLTDGAQVRVGGINEGTVKRIQLPPHPGERVRVVMDMKSDTHGVIKQDSIATISSEGLVGDKYVEVSFGTEQAQPVKAGDTLQTEKPLQVSDLIKKTSGILDSASGAVENIEYTAENLKSISSKIDQGSGTAGALINDRSLYQKADASVAALKEDTEALKHNFLLRGFFNRRGYEDSSELTKHTIPRLPEQTAVTKFSYDGNKLFDKPDTAKLKNGKMLNDAGRYLEQHPFGLAVVAGYEDLKGDSEKDRVLTEARSMVARDYLVKNFRVDDTRIRTIGFGKSAESGDETKIEVIVYPEGTKTPAENKPARR